MGLHRKRRLSNVGIPKSTLSTWKENKVKIVESYRYRYGLGVQRVKPDIQTWNVGQGPNEMAAAESTE